MPTLLAALRTRFSIPYVRKVVEKVVNTCDACQFTKRGLTALQPLHLILRVDVMDAWAMDFIGPLPTTARGNQYILTAMDLGTDWMVAQAIWTKSQESIVDMLRYIMTTYGKLITILTDNREEFMAYLVQNILRRFGIKHQHTTSGKPTNVNLELFLMIFDNPNNDTCF
jgi:hypothetical protein